MKSSALAPPPELYPRRKIRQPPAGILDAEALDRARTAQSFREGNLATKREWSADPTRRLVVERRPRRPEIAQSVASKERQPPGRQSTQVDDDDEDIVLEDSEEHALIDHQKLRDFFRNDNIVRGIPEIRSGANDDDENDNEDNDNAIVADLSSENSMSDYAERDDDDDDEDDRNNKFE